ncbi:MAG: hypothetical protein ACHQ4F_15155 [Candidatus Dormibacteria bacterium]
MTVGIAVDAHPARRRDTPKITSGGRRGIPQVSHRYMPPLKALRPEDVVLMDLLHEDTHAFQFGARGPVRPQSAHRGYPGAAPTRRLGDGHVDE